MIKAIQQLHQEMRKLTLNAGVSPSNYDLLIQDLEYFEPDELEAAHKFLAERRTNEYKEVERIWNLPNDETIWIKYEQFGITGQIEQELLAKASKLLRISWINPYRPNRKRIRNDKKSNSQRTAIGSNEVSVQSKGTGSVVRNHGTK